MKVVVASGKGGTGKTLIATNLAAMLAGDGRSVTYIDCDVEEPNGHLFLKPEITSTESASLLSPVRIDPELCTGCAKCSEVCTYNAIAVLNDKGIIFHELCHVCGACLIVCPTNAIMEEPREIGEVKHGRSGHVEIHYALLKTGEGGMSPRLVKAVKSHAVGDTVILDSPPGTACPAVESVRGADVAVLVADPTPFTVNDLKLSVNMCRYVGCEPVVVVNRAGSSEDELLAYCEQAQVEIIGRIPDDRKIAEVYSVGDLVVEKLPQYRKCFEELYARMLELAAASRPARKDLIDLLLLMENVPQRERVHGPRPEPRPKEVVVISGKGGTGKTSLVACFAALARGKVIADCDVDAADLQLVLAPSVRDEGTFSGGYTVSIDAEKCVGCGDCAEACRFDAIDEEDGTYDVDDMACEGCGTCDLVCTVEAITKREAINGRWFVSETRHGRMAHAKLGIGEENSGRLVTLVRDIASEVAGQVSADGVLIDGSPGTGCPVIASLTGAWYAVAVTEPTVSGLHDLKRILDVTRHFGVHTGVVVNKCDLNEDMARRIVEAAREAGAEYLGSIPYDAKFTEAQIRQLSLVEHDDGPTAARAREIWEKIRAAAL